MKRMGYIALVGLQTLTVALSSLGQETVTTKDGRRVVLNPDGTWHYTTNSVSAIPVSALDTVRAYLSASSWRDRLPLVLNSEKVKPLMEARYGGRPWNPSQFELLTQSEPTPTQAGWARIEADVAGRTTAYFVKKTLNGYRIDWETSVGSNPISPEEFRATRPTSPVRLRVLAKLADYYNFEFGKAQDTDWSIALTDGGGNSIGHGYIKKNTPAGQQLFQTLKDGKEHSIVVDVQCLPNAESSRVFLITKVVNDAGWWFEETEKTVQPRPAGYRR
jgi:hypothetical protein